MWTWLEERRLIYKIVIKKDPNGKIPLSRTHLRWEYRIKKYVKTIEPTIQWRDIAEDSEM
jgi:hypothetical protein